MTRTPLLVVFERRATIEVETIDSWWRLHHSTSPDLFLRALERVLEVVSLLPEAGPPARDTRLDGVRRILLTKTQHHVYYRRSANTIQVLAVWHTSRGRGPGL